METPSIGKVVGNLIGLLYLNGTITKAELAQIFEAKSEEDLIKLMKEMSKNE